MSWLICAVHSISTILFAVTCSGFGCTAATTGGIVSISLAVHSLFVFMLECLCAL